MVHTARPRQPGSLRSQEGAAGRRSEVSSSPYHWPCSELCRHRLGGGRGGGGRGGRGREPQPAAPHTGPPPALLSIGSPVKCGGCTSGTWPPTVPSSCPLRAQQDRLITGSSRRRWPVRREMHACQLPGSGHTAEVSNLQNSGKQDRERVARQLRVPVKCVTCKPVAYSHGFKSAATAFEFQASHHVSGGQVGVWPGGQASPPSWGPTGSEIWDLRASPPGGGVDAGHSAAAGRPETPSGRAACHSNVVPPPPTAHFPAWPRRLF